MIKKQKALLSTGQAAKYCLVTPDTIVNWIKRKHLPARKTPGGQFRILTNELREFMVERGMATDVLDGDDTNRHYCWENCQSSDVVPLLALKCEDCLVRRTMALNCYELRSALSDQPEDLDMCIRCRYLTECRHTVSDSELPGSISEESSMAFFGS